MSYKVLQESVTKGIYYATLVNSFKKRYLCQKCNLTFSRKCYLALHMKYHAFKCANCQRSFIHKFLLKQHLEQLHQVPREKPKEANFSCEKCQMSFATKYYYKMHMWHFHRDKYICPKTFCLKTFDTREEYIEHNRNHELRPCPICGKIVRHLYVHLLVHRKKYYMCAMCKKNFKQYHNLRRHMLIHLNLKPYSCSVCKKLFRQRYNLVIHERIHTGEKPYQCKSCDMKFVRSNTLKNHEQAVHCGKEARVFKCDKCNFSTINQWRLNYHKKQSHSQEFKCNVCSAILKSQKKLETHLWTHSKTKPFRCKICTMEYATKAGLTKHLNRFHLKEDILGV